MVQVTPRDRILEAALQVFAESGFTGATTKEIARIAKVNEVTIFRQFRTKRGLFVSVMEERSPLAEIKKSVSFDGKAPLEDILAGNAKTILTILRSNKHLFMVILGDAWRQPRVRSIVATSTITQAIEFLAQFMKGLMDAGKIRRMDPVIPSRALIGMIQAYFITTELLEGRKVDPVEEDRTVRGFVTIFLDGVRTDKGGV